MSLGINANTKDGLGHIRNIISKPAGVLSLICLFCALQ
jgi:hypothetical protein